MVFVIASATVLKRKADFVGASVSCQVGVSKRVTVVPDLHLLGLVEVVVPVERHHLDVRLLEIAVRSRVPCKPELVAYARGANNGVFGKAITKVQPVLFIRRCLGEGVVRPA
jgi:hypothetical protein